MKPRKIIWHALVLENQMFTLDVMFLLLIVYLQKSNTWGMSTDVIQFQSNNMSLMLT